MTGLVAAVYGRRPRSLCSGNRARGCGATWGQRVEAERWESQINV
jgi:hypothetical protein